MYLNKIDEVSIVEKERKKERKKKLALKILYKKIQEAYTWKKKIGEEHEEHINR